jgi:hypothetical protein
MIIVFRSGGVMEDSKKWYCNGKNLNIVRDYRCSSKRTGYF